MASHLSPSRTVITSFTPRKPSLTTSGGISTFEEGDWALCLASPADKSLPDGTIACALSNGQVLVYDQHRLHPVARYNHVHGSALSSQLVYGPQNTILSAGMDGTVQVLDPRQGTSVSQASIPQGQAALTLSIGYDGYIVAVGSDKARIHFIDLRNTKLLGSYVDSHTDAITNLSFQAGSSSTLASGSEDGLVCVFDTRQPSEERALQAVLNVGSSVRKVGFCGSRTDTAAGSFVYCLTGSESASLWNYDTAECLQRFDMDFRNRLHLQASSLTSIDYLVNAHWDDANQELLLTAGNSQGGAALYRLGQLQWELCNVLEGGHRGVVRDVCHLSQSVMVTTGEDARLCEWNRSPSQTKLHKMETTWVHPTPEETQSKSRVHGGGGPVRRSRLRSKAFPY